MKNILIGLGLIVLIVVGWTLFFDNTHEYVKVVDQEIEELEGELAGLETAVAAGTLTPEAAIEARLKIEKRLETISSSIQNSQKAVLTEAQKKQLNEGLERLKGVLVDYQSTLMMVDEQVEKLPEARKTVLRKSNNTIKKLTEVVVETVTEAEETVSEIIEDYVATPIEELFEENLDLIETDEEATTSEDVEEDQVSQDDGGVNGEKEIIDNDVAESEEGDEGEETIDEETPEEGQTESDAEESSMGSENGEVGEEGATTNQ